MDTKMIRAPIVFWCLSSFAILFGCQDKQVNEPYIWDLPHSMPEPLVENDKVMTQASVELGRHLFYDVSLSGNGTTACASCHQQGLAFAENKTVSVGAEQQPLKRNALALINLAYSESFTWAHSELTSIEQQLHLPLFNEFPVEMGVTGNEEAILARLDIPKYHQLFERAYGKQTPSLENIVLALGSFVRSLTSFNSSFDQYAYGGIDEALSEEAIAGLNLFFSERMECFHCHGGINFTESSQHSAKSLQLGVFHNTGLGYENGDYGLYEVTLDLKDKGKFKAPTLRNIALTAPYMHDGSLKTLSDVLEFYAHGGRETGLRDPNKSAFVRGFSMTENEKNALIAFLTSLTDEEFVTNPAYSAPFAQPD